MPKIIQDAQTASAAPKRRSTRKPKLEAVMPEGYNPSDDSDEEYVEMAASKRRSKDSIARSHRSVLPPVQSPARNPPDQGGLPQPRHRGCGAGRAADCAMGQGQLRGTI